MWSSLIKRAAPFNTTTAIYESVASMKLRLLLPGFAILALLLAACAPPPELRDENLLRDTSLVTNQPCAAPCWRGITPGETSWRDALTIVEDDVTIESQAPQTAEDSPASAVEFQQRDGTASCCQMFSEDGQTVSIIFLRTAPNVTVRDVITTHGEPGYAVGSPFSDDQAIVNLIYPDIPMVLYAFVPGTSGALTASSEIVGVLYMQPSDMELLLVTSNLHVWEGLNTFEAYSGEEGAVFDVTPSVTLTPTPES